MSARFDAWSFLSAAVSDPKSSSGDVSTSESRRGRGGKPQLPLFEKSDTTVLFKLNVENHGSLIKSDALRGDEEEVLINDGRYTSRHPVSTLYNMAS